MEALEDEGYVGAKIAQEGAFDAGAYGFFGDMAPLEEGLGGALEDGLDAPPEEWPATGELEDEDDLPIEALMDEDEEEDEDLSLAALLRRQMLAQQEAHEPGSSSKADRAAQQQHAVVNAANGLNKAAAAAAHSQHEQPLLPPMPPQPQMLHHLGHHQHHSSAPAALAAAAAADSAAAAPAPAAAPVPAASRPAAPSGMMTAEELEARMLHSASQPPAQPQPAGGQLLSMLKAGGGGFGSKDSSQQQQQQQQLPRQASPLHSAGPVGAMPGAVLPPGPQQQQMGPGMMGPGVLRVPPPSSLPQGVPHPFMGLVAGGPVPPPGSLDALHMHQQLQQQQQHLQRPPLPGADGALPGPGPYAGMPLPPMGPYGPGGPPHMPLHPLHGPLPPPGPHLGPHGPLYPMQHPPMHPGMIPPPGMPPMGPGMLPPGPGGVPPPGWPQGAPGGVPPRGPPLPGQLMAPPRGMVPPGFPGAPPPHHLQQPPPGFKGPMPPMEPGLGGLGPQQQGLAMQQQQHQQQQQGPGPLGPSPPRQQSPGAWGRAGAPGGPQQQQQQGPAVPRFPSPGGGAPAGAFGGGYDPSALSGDGGGGRGGAGENPAQMVHRLRTHGSEMMAADEINYILRIQHMATHGGHPYLEDFYYQAFLNKYYGGRNALIFAPSELRDLSSEGTEVSEPRFADLSGLGKIVLSNIRTPKMLMDVGSTHSSAKAGAAAAGQAAAGSGGQLAAEGKARPLEQEPMLAARIMIEDCMLLLSDVEDIDRMFAAAAAAAAGAPGLIAPGNVQTLLHRRSALLGGIAASFRLPDDPTLPADAAAGGGGGDGVFVRLMGLPKGRALVSKTLRLMFSLPPSAAGKGSKGGAAAAAAANGVSEAAGDSSSRSTATGLDVIWALLRNAEQAFGPAVAAAAGSEAERRMTDATVALSAAAGEMVKRLKKPDEAVACLAACLAGLEVCSSSSGQLLPLFPAGRVASDASPEWLGSILASLLLRASELGLGSFAAAGSAKSLGEGYNREAQEAEEQEEKDAAGGAVAAEWQALLARFTELTSLHLWGLIQAAKGGGMVVVAGAAGSVDVRPYLQKMACVPLMRVLMAHCDSSQQEQLRSYLSEVASH